MAEATTISPEKYLDYFGLIKEMVNQEARKQSIIFKLAYSTLTVILEIVKAILHKKYR
jgi:hypothetical protein